MVAGGFAARLKIPEYSRSLEPCISHGDHPLGHDPPPPSRAQARPRGRWLRRAPERSDGVIVEAGGGSKINHHQNKKGGPQGPPFLIQCWADQPPKSITARRFLGSRTPGPVGTSGSWKLLPSIAIESAPKP